MSTSSLFSLVILCYRAIEVSTSVYNNWVTVSNPSLPRVIYVGAVGYDQNTKTIYILGGSDYKNTLISYDISSNTFNDFGISYFSADVWAWSQFYAQKGNLLWAVTSPGTYFNVFDVTTQMLTTNYNGIQIPQPVSDDGCLAFHNEHLFVIGSSNKTQIYNTATNIWLSNVPRLQTERNELACAVVNNEVYAIGGIGTVTVEYLPVNDVSNIQSYQWQLISGTLPAAFRWRAVVHNDQIVAVGGCCSAVSDIIAIDPITKTINSVGNLNYAVHSTIPIIANGRFYVFSGSGETRWMYHDISTSDPSLSPTPAPTPAPTINPSIFPTQFPTVSPTNNPSQIPTKQPSQTPTRNPTQNPTKTPTFSPTISTLNPTKNPTVNPSSYPSVTPTRNPTPIPTFPEGVVGDESSDEQGSTDSNDGLQSENGSVSVFNNANNLMYIIVGGVALLVICCVLFAVYVYKKRVGKTFTNKNVTNTITNTNGAVGNTTNISIEQMIQLSSASPRSVSGDNTPMGQMTFEGTEAMMAMDTHYGETEQSDGNDGLFGDTGDTAGGDQLPELPDNEDGSSADEQSLNKNENETNELYDQVTTTGGGDNDDKELKQELIIPNTICKLCDECGKSVDEIDGGKSDKNDGNWYCHACWETFYE